MKYILNALKQKNALKPKVKVLDSNVNAVEKLVPNKIDKQVVNETIIENVKPSQVDLELLKQKELRKTTLEKYDAELAQIRDKLKNSDASTFDEWFKKYKKVMNKANKLYDEKY